MKVFVIKTPEFEADKFVEVKDFLGSFDGVVKFHFSDYSHFTTDEFPFLNVPDNAAGINSFYNNFVGDGDEFRMYIRKTRVSARDRQHFQCLTFDEIFSLCAYYRNNLQIASMVRGMSL